MMVGGAFCVLLTAYLKVNSGPVPGHYIILLFSIMINQGSYMIPIHM